MSIRAYLSINKRRVFMTLKRFHDAQNGVTESEGFAAALSELNAGKKNTHWIWYILPQLKGLALSGKAKKYEISSFEEACDYLSDPVLFDNYAQIVRCIELKLNRTSLRTLMSSDIDVQKTVSSLTLFHAAASHLIDEGSPNSVSLEALKNGCENIFKKVAPVKKKSQAAFFKAQTKNPQNIIHQLDEYIENRHQEWSFHYNFLGLMSLMYWLNDLFCGTDNFNIKSKEIKVAAANKLRNILDPDESEKTAFTPAEKSALEEGRLGMLVEQHGGLSKLTRDRPTRISPVI